jgi:hypothetical protein
VLGIIIRLEVDRSDEEQREPPLFFSLALHPRAALRWIKNETRELVDLPLCDNEGTASAEVDEST